jgi:hypothetical protein
LYFYHLEHSLVFDKPLWKICCWHWHKTLSFSSCSLAESYGLWLYVVPNLFNNVWLYVIRLY